MQTGTQQNLAEKLKEKVKAERLKTEEIFKENLQTLSKNLQESSTKELNTIESVIQHQAEQATSNLNHHYKTLSIAHGKHWTRSTLTGAAMLLGLTIASWGLLQTLTYWISIKINKLDSIQTEIQEQEQTLYHLKKDTFGIYLKISEKGKFIVLPENAKIETNWTSGDRDSIRLIEMQ